MRESTIPLDGVLNTSSRRGRISDLQRRAIGSRKTPFWLALDYSLAALVTDYNGAPAAGNFIALAIVGTSSRSRGFRTRFHQVVGEGGAAIPLSRVPIDQANAVGTAQRPLFLRHPFPMPNFLSLLNRTANRALSTDPSSGQNAIQICVYGVRDWGQET